MDPIESPQDVVPPDTQATLLLCAAFPKEGRSELKPLNVSEYNAVASWLSNEGRRLADLLGAADLFPDGAPELPERERVQALLGRGFQMATALEYWQRLGLWVIGRDEDRYPRRLRTHLRASAPVLLYGAGDAARLDQGGLAIVGSRDIDDDGLSFTRLVAERCAVSRLNVISGGARGVDQAAVAAALDAGGSAVTVLAERLDHIATSREAKELLRRGVLTLVSPYEPEAFFSVGRAMGRNKHIYTLADYALIVRFTTGTGGTWTGALEQLGRNSAGPERVPVFVRVANNPEDGWHTLQAKGALPFPEQEFAQGNIADLLRQPDASPAPIAPPAQPADFQPDPSDYDRYLPLLLQSLHSEPGAKQLGAIANKLGVKLSQFKDWVHRACAEGKVKKTKKKGKVVYVDATLAEASPLFGNEGAP